MDRAQEVLRAAKAYIDWIITEPPSWAKGIQKRRDNERVVAVYNGKNAVNTAVARPKRTESCRGDAPHSAFIDEAAFVEPEWFNRFLRPLLMIKARRFTLITTPPLKGSFFTGFIDTIKHNKNPLFAFENHSLICDQCAAKNIGDKCVHAMGKKSLPKGGLHRAHHIP